VWEDILHCLAADEADKASVIKIQGCRQKEEEVIMPRYRTRILCSKGNLKVGKDTIIMNITPATDCMSRRLGLCQVPPNACYALRAEKQYPSVLPYRRRQTDRWDELTAEEIAEDLKVIAKRARKTPVKFVRMQESGDFRHHGDLQKMNRIADLLSGVLRVYTYTAREDLFRSPVRISPNLVINGSGFMVDNNFKVVNKDQLQPGPKCRGIKGGGCFGCLLCKTKGKKTIQEELRGSKARIGADRKAGVRQHPNDTGDLFAEEGILEPVSPVKTASSGVSLQKRGVRRRATQPAPLIGGLR
jgi:hypothetical protein